MFGAFRIQGNLMDWSLRWSMLCARWFTEEATQKGYKAPLYRGYALLTLACTCSTQHVLMPTHNKQNVTCV